MERRKFIGMGLAAVAVSCVAQPDRRTTVTPPSPKLQLVESDPSNLKEEKLSLEDLRNLFTPCSSKEQLLRASQEQERPFFPIAFSPEDLEITLQKLKDPARKDHTSVLIGVINAIAYMAPVSGEIIRPEDRNKPPKELSAIIFDPLRLANGVTGWVFSGIELKPDRTSDKHHTITFFDNIGMGIAELARPGQRIKKGDPLFVFDGNGRTPIPGASISVIHYSAEGGYHSGNLANYASLDGKVLYCTMDKLGINIQRPTRTP